MSDLRTIPSLLHHHFTSLHQNNNIALMNDSFQLFIEEVKMEHGTKYYLNISLEKAKHTMNECDQQVLVKYLNLFIHILQILEADFQNVEIKNTSSPIDISDQNFLKNVKTIIEKNLDNKTLNGVFISIQLGISRMQLHRKLKALVNKSTKEFIIETRLQRAYQLLLNKKGNVSEVSELVGFSTLPYFSKVFKAKFGIVPSKLIKK